MSRFFRHTGSSLGVSDQEIELLLQGQPTGSEELAALESLVATMIDLREIDPPADSEHMGTALAALARAGAPPQWRRSRRFVAVAATVGLFFAMSGLAFAADGAVPGDLLYPVNRAFEKIGILDGGIDERLAEFETLLLRGEAEKAFEFLEEVIEEAEGADAGKAQEHLEGAAAGLNESAAAAQEKVDALRDFMEENRGPGGGLDGRDFGQGIAFIASGRDPSEMGPPEHAGSNQHGEPGPPDHAGPTDGEPGPPDQAGTNQGNQGNQSQGNEGNQSQGNEGNQGQGNQGQGKEGNQGNQGEGQGRGQGNQDDD
jgi:hypothetical protein